MKGLHTLPEDVEKPDGRSCRWEQQGWRPEHAAFKQESGTSRRRETSTRIKTTLTHNSGIEMPCALRVPCALALNLFLTLNGKPSNRNSLELPCQVPVLKP